LLRQLTAIWQLATSFCPAVFGSFQQLTVFASAVDGGLAGSPVEWAGRKGTGATFFARQFSAVDGIFFGSWRHLSAVDGSFRQLAGSGRKFPKISKSPSCPLHGRAVGSILVWDAAQFDICHTKVVKMKTFFRN